PSLGYADDSVVVTAGQPANIAFRIKRAAAPLPAPPPPAAESTPATIPATASSTPASSTPASSTTPTAPPPRQR
ncbi:MAG: hypothetical protein ACJ8AJ_06940, partial [Gemmatimonadaceae bacterium]